MTYASIIVATPHRQDLAFWQNVLKDAPDMKVTAHAPGLMELFNKVEHAPPQLVMICQELCHSDGFELMETLFLALDVRWLFFESQGGHIAKGQSLRTLSAQGGVFPLALSAEPSSLINHLRAVLNAAQKAEKRSAPAQFAPVRKYRRMVLIGASTGGVDALKTVLSHFDEDCPPTVIVQHTGEGFGNGLVHVLSRASSAKVRLVEGPIEVTSGMICVIAGQRQHMVFARAKRPTLVCSNDPPMSGHCPSIDKLFLSAVPFAPRIVAAILTGMGQDGAKGLMELRTAGARTIVQDKETSVVYGMPGAAASLGAAVKTQPLQNIGQSLLNGAL